MIVAIDGPAGSGKSTTARAVADRLGFHYLDTGAMYRAAALALRRSGVHPKSDAVGPLLQRTRIDLDYTHGHLSVRLDGEDVSQAIRHPEVSAAVSEVAARDVVRERLVEEQRRMANEFLARGEGVVLDGRDIGTHVFPAAEVKIFLIADDAIRAARRMSELRSQGVSTSYDAVLADIRRRDHLDSTRAIAPLRRADDALEVDTSRLSIEQQVEIVERIVRERSAHDSV